MSNKVTAPKGVKDLFPPEIAKWQYLEQKVREYFSRFMYREIRTPIFEHSELFLRGIGSETEVVQKEMYTFEDKSGRSITLRPENTASVVRAAIENNLFNDLFPPRFFYIGPMFRYEKPQKGRFRQFHQLGLEVFDDASPGVDAEVIYCAWSFLEHIGVQAASLFINSVGCPECRPGFLQKLEAEAARHESSLCADCQRKIHSNPLRIFDCKNEACATLSEAFPKITDHLCSDCHSHFAAVRKFLEILGVPFTVNPRMVRGLDYYTKTAFEITSGQLGAQNAVLGGGRYNNLVKELGGADICGIGFAAGMERIVLHLPDMPDKPSKTIFIAYQKPELEPEAVKLTKTLWEKGVAAYICYDANNMKKQFKRGDRIGADFTFVIGEDEVAQNAVSIKYMATRQQITLQIEELDQWLKNNL